MPAVIEMHLFQLSFLITYVISGLVMSLHSRFIVADWKATARSRDNLSWITQLSLLLPRHAIEGARVLDAPRRGEVLRLYRFAWTPVVNLVLATGLLVTLPIVFLARTVIRLGWGGDEGLRCWLDERV